MRKSDISLPLFVVRAREKFDYNGVHHFDADQDYYADYRISGEHNKRHYNGFIVYPNALDEPNPSGIFFPIAWFNKYFNDVLLTSDHVYL